MADEYWIQEAIKKPGAFRAWCERNREKIKRVIGEDIFDKRGRLKKRAVRKLKRAVQEGRIRVSETTKKRIVLADTLMNKLR